MIAAIEFRDRPDRSGEDSRAKLDDLASLAGAEPAPSGPRIILRVAASIHTGTVAASLILRQLASYPRQNGLAAALCELGGAKPSRGVKPLDRLPSDDGVRLSAIEPIPPE